VSRVTLRSQVTYKRWATGDKDWELKTFSIGDARTLSSWKSKLTGRQYSNVAVVDRSY